MLNSLVTDKASGPNGFCKRMLKELSKELINPLCSLFNCSLQKRKLPSLYKEANICPIHKLDDKSLVNNYQPKSRKCRANVFERLIIKHLFNHLQENNILTSLQSGFIPGHSTVNQLTFLYNLFCQALDAGREIRVPRRYFFCGSFMGFFLSCVCYAFVTVFFICLGYLLGKG